MTAGHCHFDRTLGVVLTANVAEVLGPPLSVLQWSVTIDLQRINRTRSVNEIDDFRQRSHWINRNTFDHGSLTGVGRRNQHVRDLAVTRKHRDGKHALDGTQLPIQRQLAHHQVIRQVLFGQQPMTAENTHSHG